ncbi:hypothetical protein ONZ43_g7239 [Nemania bipapillata]|uniref:Uncharacterized protein n=1 Tax=Nemania bipapillata TaxID=110536 RepID=A0ACC2HT24_9PEZI|nr:hypothetical protein ONZ43_g7239 [Nemania bipapillata]
MDGLNEYRTVRVAEVLSDFRDLQYYITAAPTNPLHDEDYYTEGWAALRQCALDGQHILNCAADVTVPHARGGEEEQVKAELKQSFRKSQTRASTKSFKIQIYLWVAGRPRIQVYEQCNAGFEHGRRQYNINTMRRDQPRSNYEHALDMTDFGIDCD